MSQETRNSRSYPFQLRTRLQTHWHTVFKLSPPQLSNIFSLPSSNRQTAFHLFVFFRWAWISDARLSLARNGRNILLFSLLIYCFLPTPEQDSKHTLAYSLQAIYYCLLPIISQRNAPITKAVPWTKKKFVTIGNVKFTSILNF